RGEVSEIYEAGMQMKTEPSHVGCHESQDSAVISSFHIASTDGGTGQSMASAMARRSSASRSFTRLLAVTVRAQAARMLR
ncbi:MAG TPA: hypothetical protein VKA67_08895, partial [Verrucomicrobiae bacterium]|nr:hypothetical protein [Verrucomicrobiae bacterium]